MLNLERVAPDSSEFTFFPPKCHATSYLLYRVQKVLWASSGRGNRGRAGSQFGSYDLIYITLLLVLTPVLQVEKNSELDKKPFKPLSDESLFVRELTSRDGSSLVAA